MSGKFNVYHDNGEPTSQRTPLELFKLAKETLGSEVVSRIATVTPHHQLPHMGMSEFIAADMQRPESAPINE